jgi:hypothetical protein
MIQYPGLRTCSRSAGELSGGVDMRRLPVSHQEERWASDGGGVGQDVGGVLGERVLGAVEKEGLIRLSGSL